MGVKKNNKYQLLDFKEIILLRESFIMHLCSDKAAADEFSSSKCSTLASAYKANYKTPMVWKATVKYEASEFQSHCQYW